MSHRVRTGIDLCSTCMIFFSNGIVLFFQLTCEPVLVLTFSSKTLIFLEQVLGVLKSLEGTTVSETFTLLDCQCVDHQIGYGHFPYSRIQNRAFSKPRH
jgi:hypothetical protein